MKINENSLRDLWDNIKCTNAHITRISGGERRGAKNIFKDIIAKIFPNLGENVDIHIQEFPKVPSKMKQRDQH